MEVVVQNLMGVTILDRKASSTATLYITNGSRYFCLMYIFWFTADLTREDLRVKQAGSLLRTIQQIRLELRHQFRHLGQHQISHVRSPG